MTNLTQDNSTEAASQALMQAVAASFGQCPDARLREVLSVVVRHLHEAVRKARVTEGEWAAAIDFLTRTGQMCTSTRQEFILLSDVIGISMQVDLMSHEHGDGATPSTVLGPFYVPNQRHVSYGESVLLRPEAGEEVLVRGQVRSVAGVPLAGATLEVWQTAPNGLYDVQDPDQPAGHMRGTLVAGPNGEFAVRTMIPESYSIPVDGPVGQLLGRLNRSSYRPAHIHFRVAAEGHEALVTHLFVVGDPYLASDAVFGVKSDLIVEPVMVDGEKTILQDFCLSAV